MPRRSVLVLLLLLACTRSSEPAVGSADEPTQPVPPPAKPRLHCNRAVADVEAAIARASTLLPAPSSTGLAREWKDETIELWLMPAVPPSWPVGDCRLVFYVFAWCEVEPKPRDGLYWEDPLPYAWGGIEAKITVALDSGEAVLEPVEGRPGGVNPRHGTGPMPVTDQQLVFDAVATNSALSEEAIRAYHEWFTRHPYASAIFWIWHRDFFDAVVGDDESLRTEISDPAKAYLRGIRPGNWTDFENWSPPAG
jgi:hypothetical protein